MKTLIITAHPGQDSFTKKIAKTILENTKDAEIMDLYDPKYTQGFLQFEGKMNLPKDEKRDLIQKKISEAKNLIFVHPVFWNTPPAIMKNFIEQNFTAGFAFKYEENKPIPKGLLG